LNRSIRVALDVPLRVGDAALTFSAGAAPEARRGDAVVVPVGRRLMPGIVLGDDEWRPDLRPVLAAAGSSLIPPAAVDLAEWVAGEYLARSISGPS
jgi:primosomal protein N'